MGRPVLSWRRFAPRTHTGQRDRFVFRMHDDALTAAAKSSRREIREISLVRGGRAHVRVFDRIPRACRSRRQNGARGTATDNGRSACAAWVGFVSVDCDSLSLFKRLHVLRLQWYVVESENLPKTAAWSRPAEKEWRRRYQILVAPLTTHATARQDEQRAAARSPR